MGGRVYSKKGHWVVETIVASMDCVRGKSRLIQGGPQKPVIICYNIGAHVTPFIFGVKIIPVTHLIYFFWPFICHKVAILTVQNLLLITIGSGPMHLYCKIFQNEATSSQPTSAILWEVGRLCWFWSSKGYRRSQLWSVGFGCWIFGVFLRSNPNLSVYRMVGWPKKVSRILGSPLRKCL